MKQTSSPQDQEQDQEIIEILKGLESYNVEYPPELLAARRAGFVAQVNQHGRDGTWVEQPSKDQVVRYLEGLQSAPSEYPPALLAARRAAFIARVEQLHGRVDVKEELFSEDQDIIRLFKTLKAVEADYPSNLMAAQRTAFRRQIALGERVSLLEALRSSVRSLFLDRIKMPSMPAMSMLRTSLVVAVLMVAAFVGSSVLVNREQLLNLAPTQESIAQPGPILTATGTAEVAKIICKPGYLPPLCLAKEFDKSEDLTFQGNGAARPAVAKDTLPGYDGIHDAAYVNDGLYGPGSSWVSNSAYSWIKIDLGKPATINTVAFGRDRLGSFHDRSPGQFVIAVALDDNIYADGNSTNDYVEYIKVYDSKQAGYDGIVLGSETIKASFEPVIARYVKIVFANAGAAVDEVEVFMAQPPVLADYPTRRPKDDGPAAPSTPYVFNTPRPLPTNTARPIPTNTPLPTDTPVPPTNTPRPTDTPIPPTNTPRPPNTTTPVPPNTATPVPPTVVPTEVRPTNIPTNVPADTPIPPADTAAAPAIASPETSGSEELEVEP